MGTATSSTGAPPSTPSPPARSRAASSTTRGRRRCRIPVRRVNLTNGEHFDLYDTSGPYTDDNAVIDLEAGLPQLRDAWTRRPSTARRPSSPGPAPGIITPEMRFIAAREGVPAELVRDEVARGRAVIPANHNHPESEPMIIGKKFAVKINANIGNSAVTSLHRRGGREDGVGHPLGRRHHHGPVHRQATSTRPASGSCATPRSRSAPCRSIRRWRRSTATPPQLTLGDLPRHRDRAVRAGRGLHDRARRACCCATSR